MAERDRNKDRQMEQRDIQTNIHIQIDGETEMFRKGETEIHRKGKENMETKIPRYGKTERDRDIQ